MTNSCIPYVLPTVANPMGTVPNSREFVMSVIDDKLAKPRRINVPPPVMEKLGNPTHIKFVIRG